MNIDHERHSATECHQTEEELCQCRQCQQSYVKQNSFSILLFPGIAYDEAVRWAQNGQGLPRLKSRSWGVPLG